MVLSWMWFCSPEDIWQCLGTFLIVTIVGKALQLAAHGFKSQMPKTVSPRQTKLSNPKCQWCQALEQYSTNSEIFEFKAVSCLALICLSTTNYFLKLFIEKQNCFYLFSEFLLQLHDHVIWRHKYDIYAFWKLNLCFIFMPWDFVNM